MWKNGRLTQVTFAEKARIDRHSPGLLRFKMENVSRLVIKDDYIDHPRFERLSIDVPITSPGADLAAGNQYDTRTGLELQRFARDKSNDRHDRRWAQIEFWLRISQAMACFAFTIFAIPSGILSSQKSKTSGFIISILYALIIFFPMVMGLRSFLHSPAGYGFHPNLILIPNWLFIIYGAYLMGKVLRQ
ncbi:LptF/LptG family permease [Planctomycetota bacterium]